TAAVVGEARARVGARGRTNGDRVRRARRRTVAGVLTFIARGNHHGHAGIAHAGHGVVGCLRGAPAQAHVGHGRELRIAGNPVHSGNDAGVGTGAVTAQNANGVQGGLLGYAISGAGHRATDVRAVTVTVGPAAAVVDGGIAVTHATAEFVVRAEQAGIDDVAV